MKALLVSLPPMDPYFPPPILSVLASCCETANVNYEVEDLNLHLYNSCELKFAMELSNDLTNSTFRSYEHENHFNKVCQHLLDKINMYIPDYLCISVFSYKQNFAAHKILEKISCLQTKCKIILGGSGIHSPYLDHNKFGLFCINNSLANYAVFGDGEIAFIELLKGNTAYPGINKLNNIQIKDLDSLPLPSYKKIDFLSYKESGIIITGSKGCVRDCTFCDINSIWPKYVFKSGKRIADEMYRLWQETGISKFYFSDSLINGSVKNFRDLNKQLIQLKNNNSNFQPQYLGQFICRPVGQLTDNDYKEMSKAGALTLIVGIESFSNNVRNHMRKKFDNDSIADHLALCAKYGIKNTFLLLSGYVTETIKDHEENLRYLEKYQVYALSGIISNISFNIGGLDLESSPDSESGVPLNAMEKELGIMYHVEETDRSSQNWINLSNPSLTVKERYRRSVELLIHATKLGYKVMYLKEHLDGLEKYHSFLSNKSHIKKLIPIV